MYRGIEIDRMGLDNVFFMDICNLIDRSPSLIVHEKPATVHGRNPIVRSELLDLLENKFHSFSEIQQSNLRIYITNNKLTNVIKLPNEQSI